MNSPDLDIEMWSPFVPTIDEQNPWPGLAPYPASAAPFFHGREEEIQELLRLVRREDLAVVHGKSGVGKTSLLQAGFIPLLEAEDCMPVLIRLDHSPTAPALLEQVKSAIAQAMLEIHVDGPAAEDQQTLWEFFHRRGGQFWGPRNRLLMPVLIFTKFEELFSLGCATDETRHRTNEFLPHLIDLIDNRLPLEVRRRLIDGSTESAQWNFEDSGCKVVLCLKKEYVTDLDWLALRALSDEKRLGLGMLRGDLAVDAVAGAGSAVLDRETAERIVRFCADSSTAVDVTAIPISAPSSAAVSGVPIPTSKSNPGTGAAAPAPVPTSAPPSTTASAPPVPSVGLRKLGKLDVEPALLSLICRELNNERQRLGETHIDAGRLTGTPADVLKAFYERSIGGVPLAVRVFVEERLLTKFGHRKAIILEDALAIEGISAESIRTLVDRQLLRVDDRLGTTRLELSHEVLIEPVRQSRDARRAAEEASMLERLAREFARRMRRDRVVVAAGIVVCAIAVGLLLVLIIKGWHERDRQAGRAARAEQQLVQTKAEKQAADKARSDAEAALALADMARTNSETKLTAAEAQKLASEQLAAKAKADLDAANAAKAESELAASKLREQIALEASRVALNEAEGHEREGNLLQQSGKNDQAIAAFTDELNGLSKLDPTALASEKVQRMVADTNEKLGNLVLASKAPAGAQKYLEAAQASLDALIKTNPNDLGLRRRSLAIARSLGDLLQKSNALAARRKCLGDGLDATKKFLQLAPGDAEALRHDCYFAAELGGMDLAPPQDEPAARKHFADAAESWAALLALNSAEPEAKTHLLKFAKYLGDVSLIAGDYRDAVKWYGIGLAQFGKPDAVTEKELPPWNDPPEFMHGLGISHLKLNELPPAREALVREEGFRLSHPRPTDAPKLWATYGDLSAICMTLPDYPAARSYLEKRLALASKPPSAEQLAELPKLYAALGKACVMTNDLDAAEKAFKDGLNLDARNVALKRGLADLYAQIADSKLKARQDSDGRALLEKAASLYRDLNASNPGDAELSRLARGVSQRLGDVALNEAEGHGREGDALQQAGKRDQAISAFMEELQGLSKLDAASLASEKVQRLAADANEKLGNLALTRSDPAGAQKYLEAAQASLAGLIKTNPKELELRRRSLAISRSLCELLKGSNALATRRKCLGDGLETTKALLQLAPKDAGALRYDCYFATEIGLMDLTPPRDETSARKHFADAVNSWNALLAVNPAEPDARSNLLMLYKWLGDTALSAGENRDAARWYGLCLGLLGKTETAADKDFPASDFMHGLGVARLNLRELAAARDAFAQEESYRLARPAAGDGQKLWIIYRDLADICMKLPDYPAAKGYLEKRVALAKRPPTADELAELPKIYAALGKACSMTNDPEAAERAFQDGFKLDPGNVTLKRAVADLDALLAESKLMARRDSEARVLLEKAATLYAELNAANPRDAELRRATLNVFQRLGEMALTRGDPKLSQTIYQQYVEIVEAAVKADPRSLDPDLVENQLVGYEGLGDASIELKDRAMAKTWFEKYKQVIESRFGGDKSSAPALHSLAVAYGKLGAFCGKLDATDARHYFEKEIDTLDTLPDTEKNTLEAKCDLSQGLGKLASICTRLSDNATAVTASKRAVDVDEKLSQAQPANQDLRRNASASNTGMGDAILRVSGAAAAKPYYLRGRDLAELAFKADDSIESKLVFAKSLRQCGYISLELKDPPGAAAYYRRALSIDQPISVAAPENSDIQLRLVQDLIGIGAAARAARDERTAIASFIHAQDIVSPLRNIKSAAGRSADELSAVVDSWLKGAGPAR